jgi:hypothetical protein
VLQYAEALRTSGYTCVRVRAGDSATEKEGERAAVPAAGRLLGGLLAKVRRR